MIDMRCLQCCHEYEVDDALVGRVVKCPECTSPLRVPGEISSGDKVPKFWAGEWVYKMVQIPPTIVIPSGKGMKEEGAAYLEEVVNHHASRGWEFYRVDEIGVRVRPGWLAGLLGEHAKSRSYYVITFRRKSRQE